VSKRTFFGELKRRRVYRVALGYGIAASAIVQVGGTILPIFHAPEWLQQLFVVLIALGFPVALLLGWAFDVTIAGIRRTPNVKGLPVSSARQLWTLGILGTVVAALALSGYWFWHPWRRSADFRPSLTANATPEKSIAVLPFENLSTQKENAFFAEGVQDQILTNLAKVSDLKVISNISVQQYQTGIVRNLREIGQQLGVAYILEGTVQRESNRIRVTAQLIDAGSASQLWAETYDRDAADLFAIQSEIAQAIVGQLQAKLSPQEKADIEERPTQDLVAFDLYLQAKGIVDTYLDAQDPHQSLLQAVRLLDEATKRDASFVLAYCYTARAHDLLYFLDLDPTPARALLAEAAVKTALRLRPDSAEAHLTMGDYYFRCHRDYTHAQEELAIARPGLPNSIPFFFLSAYIDRRQGRWAEAERDLVTAVGLDPRNPNAVNLLVDTYVLERRFSEAVRAYDRAIAAGSQAPIIYIRKAAVEFSATGDTKVLSVALANAPPELDVGGGETALRILLALIDRNYPEASRVLSVSPRHDFQEVDFSFYYPRAWYEAIIARAKGDQSTATAGFAAARSVFETRLRVKPNDPRTLAVIAQVDAGLGKKELAIREGQEALKLMPVSKDAYDGPLVLQGLAQVYAWTGEPAQAVELVRTLMSIPGYLTPGYLKRDPSWDPLRGDPGFEKLAASITLSSTH